MINAERAYRKTPAEKTIPRLIILSFIRRTSCLSYQDRMFRSPPAFSESAQSSNIIRPINHAVPAFKKRLRDAEICSVFVWVIPSGLPIQTFAYGHEQQIHGC